MCTWLFILWEDICIISCILVTLSAQNEEILYYYDFAQQSDWIVDEGTYNAAVHTYIPIKWKTSDTTGCPRTKAGDTSAGAYRCMQAMKDGSISREISTVGFHSIRLQIDVAAYSVEISDDDWCIVQYRTATTNWANINILQGETSYVLNYEIIIPDNNNYNNQLSFEVKVGIAANTGGDNCLFDNLIVFGIAYTSNPTAFPSMNPSRDPSLQPTVYPSAVPSAHPSINPSASKSNPPTHNPALAPTKPPTFAAISTHHMYYNTTPVISATEAQSHAMKPHKSNDVIDVYIVPVSVLLSCLVCFASILFVVFRAKRSRAATAAYDEDMKKAQTEIVPKNKEVAVALDDNSKSGRNDDGVLEWLMDAVQLPQYLNNFLQNGYDCLEFIKEIQDESELVEIGVILIGHQVRLMKQINLLKARDHAHDKHENTHTVTAEADLIKSLEAMPQLMATDIGLYGSDSDIDLAIAIRKQLQENVGDDTAGFVMEDASDED